MQLLRLERLPDGPTSEEQQFRATYDVGTFLLTVTIFQKMWGISSDAWSRACLANTQTAKEQQLLVRQICCLAEPLQPGQVWDRVESDA